MTTREIYPDWATEPTIHTMPEGSHADTGTGAYETFFGPDHLTQAIRWMQSQGFPNYIYREMDSMGLIGL